MDKVKNSRINNAYMEQLNILFGKEIKNPILKNVVVTEVKVSSDLSYAKVYFTCFNDDKEKVIKELNDSKGHLRSELAKKVLVRHTPELTFEYDNSIEYANRIETIIKEIHDKENKSE
jgi:ribosome-binding factor A